MRRHELCGEDAYLVHAAESTKRVDACGGTILAERSGGKTPIVHVEERERAGGITSAQRRARIAEQNNLRIER